MAWWMVTPLNAPSTTGVSIYRTGAALRAPSRLKLYVWVVGDRVEIELGFLAWPSRFVASRRNAFRRGDYPASVAGKSQRGRFARSHLLPEFSE